MADSRSLVKVGTAARGFFELCGRHPLITGILSVFGVGFSFFTFGLNQMQSAQDEVESKALIAKVATVETAVTALASQSTEKTLADPIASRVPKSSFIAPDNVTFPASLMGKPMSWIMGNSKASFSNIPFFEFSVKSSANRDYVQIASYLVVDVISVRPISPDVAAIYAGERGAAGELRTFSAALMPRTGYQYAALIDGNTGELRSDVAYFSLSPREPEEFFLQLAYEPGYLFTYKVGLHYRFQDQDAVHWLTGPIRAGVPEAKLPVAHWYEGQDPVEEMTFEEGDHPDLVSLQDTAGQSARFRAAVFRGRVFNPTQLKSYTASVH